MEAFETAINATCPLAFAGASGVLFMKAITSVVAAHCAIVDDNNQWPKDEAEDILNSEGDLKFDFVIVGAGTAGSAFASRLSSHFRSVLLIEAGDNPGLDSEVPALMFLNQNSNLSWDYKTNPDGKACLGFNNKSCVWSKGRCMGGSSSINAMLYIRGHPNDYNQWEDEGNSRWAYRDLLPYFDKIESKLNLADCVEESNPWYDIIKKAWQELGFNFDYESNESKTGTRITKLLTKDGKRLNTGKLYLDEKGNLHVMKNTVVQKIIIDSNSATGVQIKRDNGEVFIITVNREVILSAGSIATPQILMLSGIGPKLHLAKHDIKCSVDLPVGKNLQDHLLVPIFLKTNQHTQVSTKDIYLSLIKYMMEKSGPFSRLGITDFMGFLNSDSLRYPNIQFHHTYFIQNDNFMLKPYLKGVGYNEEIIRHVEDLNRKCDLLGVYPTLLHPKSRGEILLASADPETKPIIKPNYFQNKDDLKVLIKGIQFIRNLTTTDSFKSVGVQLASLKIANCSQLDADSDDYWECYLRHMATTIYHPVGTTKMGVVKGVVDERLLVRGVRNLTVVDASIMPTITSGNTMAPTLVIAEKAADLIKTHYGKDEL